MKRVLLFATLVATALLLLLHTHASAQQYREGNREESYTWLARAALNGNASASKLRTDNGISSSRFKEYAARKTRLDRGTTPTLTKPTPTQRTTTTGYSISASHWESVSVSY